MPRQVAQMYVVELTHRKTRGDVGGGLVVIRIAPQRWACSPDESECYNFQVLPHGSSQALQATLVFRVLLRWSRRIDRSPRFLHVGEWLSLVEHLVRDQGVGGSNPLSPTI